VRWQKKPSIDKTISQDEIEILEASGEMRSTQSPASLNSGIMMINDSNDNSKLLTTQGPYGSWKTWKVLEFCFLAFQDWKFVEFLSSYGKSWKT